MPHSVSERSLVPNVCPVQLGNSEIVLEDDYGNSNPLDVEQYTCTNREVVNLENAAVNIDNSSDVIIGPVTQFNVNGNVTIYQNGQNGQLESITETITVNHEEDVKCNGGLKTYNTLPDPWCDLLFTKAVLHKNHIRNFAIILLVLLICLVLALVLVEKLSEASEYDYDYKESRYGNRLGNHTVYYRPDWDGLPPKRDKVLLQHPVPMVIITDSTTNFCESAQNCSELVKALQKKHLAEPFSSSDVGYNFLVGGDGGIYVGRGWDVENFQKKNSILISFVGNFVFDELTSDMVDATLLLIAQGVELKKLTDDYRLVGNNQTNPKMYLNPGENAYRVIKTWPHFYNNTMF